MTRMPGAHFMSLAFPGWNFTRSARRWTSGRTTPRAVRRSNSAPLDGPSGCALGLLGAVASRAGTVYVPALYRTGAASKYRDRLRWPMDRAHEYAYYEVKTFLATELYDYRQTLRCLRTRALANGGTLGLESTGFINRRIIESRAGWTETAVLMYLLRGPFTLLLYRYGEAYASNPAEKTLFRRCAQGQSPAPGLWNGPR